MDGGDLKVRGGPSVRVSDICDSRRRDRAQKEVQRNVSRRYRKIRGCT